MSEGVFSGGARAVAPDPDSTMAPTARRPPTPNLNIRWLGRISFPDALQLQEELVSKKRTDAGAPDEILLLEHDPVYTIGRTPDQSSLRGGNQLPHPLFAINRGGQATYHGPGQLVGYPILDLRRHGQDLHRYLRWLEQLIIELLGAHQIIASRRDGLTGVWVQNRESGRRLAAESSDQKIASIGVGVRHWITMHGFALNVGGDLSPFNHITPCGIAEVTITSMEKEAGRAFSLIDVATEFERLVARRLLDLRS